MLHIRSFHPSYPINAVLCLENLPPPNFSQSSRSLKKPKESTFNEPFWYNQELLEHNRGF
uniref:Uncharacterized protein n=1 Tax=Megaselia scalaris TaxID=36166 RepID=T1GBJ4_MEGSC